MEKSNDSTEEFVKTDGNGVTPSKPIDEYDFYKYENPITEKEIDKYLGDYVKERAVKRGETNTTVIKRGDHWKVLVKYLKN